MYCAHCGKELASGATTCVSCGYSTPAPAPASSRGSSSDPVDEILWETKQAVKSLVAATAKLSKELGSHAEAAVNDASGTARKARDRLKKDLHTIVQDVSDALKKL